VTEELRDIRINGVDVVRMASWLDKSLWGEGEWLEEPDLVNWDDPATGLECMAIREDEMGHWCGYVRVARGHPLFGKLRLAIEEHDDLQVHGGITYAYLGRYDVEHPERSLRSYHQSSDPRGEWWLGFDTAHARDYSPNLPVLLLTANLARLTEDPIFKRVMERIAPHLRDRMEKLQDLKHYRNLGFVMTECHHLAHQLARLDRRTENVGRQPPPPERECQHWVPDQVVRREVWSPAHRCKNWTLPGRPYCSVHDYFGREVDGRDEGHDGSTAGGV